MNSVTITLSAATLNTIGAALGEIPFKIARPAVAEIEAQVSKYLMEQKGKGNEQDSGGATPP